MSKFESIDDFLSDRLSDQDKAAFEKQLASDPQMKADVGMQRQIIEGVRQARRIELKTMLNNVPIPAGGSSSVLTAAGKIAATVLTAGVVSTAGYFGYTHFANKQQATEDTRNGVISPAPKITEASPDSINTVGSDKAIPRALEQAAEAKPDVTTARPKEISKAKKEAGEQGAAREDAVIGKTDDAVTQQQPKISVVDPSEEMIDTRDIKKEESPSASRSNNGTTSSRIAVDIHSGNKKYNFHYQFLGGKLVLYGPFDKSLYEILEINSEKKLVFLVYKDQYYQLTDKDQAISALVPINDATLVRKLKEYRGN